MSNPICTICRKSVRPGQRVCFTCVANKSKPARYGAEADQKFYCQNKETCLNNGKPLYGIEKIVIDGISVCSEFCYLEITRRRE